MTDQSDTHISRPGLDDLQPTIDAFAGVPAKLAGALRERGFEGLTSVQQAVLAAESDGRDLRISSQTGSGKTVAIGLAVAPRLIGDAEAGRSGRRGPAVFVLVPTRELAMQVRDELSWLFADVRGIGITVLMGGTSIGLERRELTRGPQVVVGTPGRTLDHVKSGALVCSDVTHVVLDEADRMLDMGFREELEAILEGMPAERCTHLVSATFDPAVRRLADRHQTRPLHVEGTKLGAANADIEHVVHLVGPRGAYAAIVNHLLLNEGRRCLIFVERRVDVTSLTEKLSADGFPVQAFSGELPQAQRTRTLNAFRDGTIKTLVSTDVAARGIDVPNIELVIHADPPESADTYVHRSGRTGRAGSTGHSVLLCPPKAKRYVTRVLETARISADWLPAPTAAKVRKRLRRRFRQQLHEKLAVEGGPDQKQVDYAKLLLDGREPAEVVAHLLDLAQPIPPRAPMDVPEPSHEVVDRGRRAEQRDAGHGRYVTFSINWGRQGGAAPNRILSHVCRRGEVRGQAIGSIRVGERSSTFQVDAREADRFEARAKRPDPREPKVRIVRAADGGPAPRSPGAERSRPERPSKPHRKDKGKGKGKNKRPRRS